MNAPLREAVKTRGYLAEKKFAFSAIEIDSVSESTLRTVEVRWSLASYMKSYELRCMISSYELRSMNFIVWRIFIEDHRWWSESV